MDIDFNKIEFGEGHGNLFNFFKNIYYEKRYIKFQICKKVRE